MREGASEDRIEWKDPKVRWGLWGKRAGEMVGKNGRNRRSDWGCGERGKVRRPERMEGKDQKVRWGLVVGKEGRSEDRKEWKNQKVRWGLWGKRCLRGALRTERPLARLGRAQGASNRPRGVRCSDLSI